MINITNDSCNDTFCSVTGTVRAVRPVVTNRELAAIMVGPSVMGFRVQGVVHLEALVHEGQSQVRRDVRHARQRMARHTVQHVVLQCKCIDIHCLFNTHSDLHANRDFVCVVMRLFEAINL